MVHNVNDSVVSDRLSDVEFSQTGRETRLKKKKKKCSASILFFFPPPFLSSEPLVLLQVRLVECCFSSTETLGLLGTGAQDGRLDFHTAPELCDSFGSLLAHLYPLSYIQDA